MPSKKWKSLNKIRVASHFLKQSRLVHQTKSKSDPVLLHQQKKMDKKLSSLQIMIHKHSSHHKQMKMAAAFQKTNSKFSGLRRLSLFHKVTASHALQAQIKNKFMRQSRIRNAKENATSPVHVVSKTRELVNVSNKSAKGKESVTRYVKILQKSKHFSGLTNDQLVAIVLRLQTTQFIPGEYLMRQGSYGDSLYLVEAGRVQVTRHSPNNPDKEQKLTELGSGVLLGEIALLTDGQRTASVYAISSVRCLCMSRTTFEELVDEGLVPDIAKTLKEQGNKAMETEALDRVKLFHSMTQKERRQVVNVMGRRVYNDGDVIIKEGEKADSFYVVVTGMVRVMVSDAGEIGGQRQVTEYYANDYFGETGLLYGAPRSASVIAVGQVKTMCLHKLNFMAMIPEDIIRTLDAEGTMNRIGDAIKETEALSNSPFVSDYSRRQTLSSAVAEARHFKNQDNAESGGAGVSSIGLSVQSKKSKKRSKKTKGYGQFGYKANSSTNKKRTNGRKRLIRTIKTFQNKNMNYNFVPLSILNLFKETHSKIKKLQIEETIVSHLGTAPNKTSSKFKKNDYREKSSQLFRKILNTSTANRTKTYAKFIVESIQICGSFATITKILNPLQLENLVKSFTTFYECDAMTPIFDQGPTNCSKAYMLLSGGVRIIKTKNSGSKSLVAILKPGDSFGELAIKGIGVRPHGAVATAASEFLVVDREGYLKVLGWHLHWNEMNLMKKSNSLSGTGIFPAYAQDQLLQTALLFYEKVYTKGSILFQEGTHAPYIVLVLHGSVTIRTLRNKISTSRSYGSATAARSSSAIRRGALSSTLLNKKKFTKVKDFKGQMQDVVSNKLQDRSKYTTDYDTKYGLEIAMLGQGAILGLGVSEATQQKGWKGSKEPYTAIASSDTACLVLPQDFVKNLLLGKGGIFKNKVRHRNSAAAMQSIFQSQCDFAVNRSNDLRRQLNRRTRVVKQAVAFREKKSIPTDEKKAKIDTGIILSLEKNIQRRAVSSSSTPLSLEKDSMDSTTLEMPQVDEMALTVPKIEISIPQLDNSNKNKNKKQKRPSSALPTRLKPIIPLKKRNNPRHILNQSLKELKQMEKVARSKFGSPKHANIEHPRHTSTTEYWSTVKRRRQRPSSAPYKRRTKDPTLMSAKDYTEMRNQRLKEAIIGSERVQVR